MKQTLIYVFYLLIFLSSCTYDVELERRGEEEVYMNLSTRSLDPSMTQVRIIVTDVLSGEVLINEYPVQRESSEDYKLSIQTGERNFYVILNEPSTLSPKLNDIGNSSALSTLMLNRDELPAYELIDNSVSQTNLPAMGWAKASVRSASLPTHGEASTDGGTTWNNTVAINLERMATKITLALRKNTPDPLDIITVKSITAINIPYYEYVLASSYESEQFDTQLIQDTPVSFASNETLYTQIFSDYIMPEYIPANPADKDKSLVLKLDAEYNGVNVIYYIPIRGDMDREDYSLKRNNHYIIKATISSEGEMLFLPEVKYQVADWSEVNIGSDIINENVITFSHRWETGADIDGTNVFVTTNGYVDFYFTLARPTGSTWSATLSNNTDFMFDETDGNVSQGMAREGKEYRIRIRPRNETQLEGLQTLFYITVHNDAGDIELNLPNQATPGTQNRYTITQIPN